MAIMINAARFRAGLAAALAGLALAACGGADEGQLGALGAHDKPEDRAIGAPDAPVTMIEYASVTCPTCKYWHDTVWPDVKAQYVDTGKVRFVFREIPTAPQDVAMAGFLIARAAPEDRYFAVLDTLFERRERILASPDRRAELLAVARSAGLSEAEFEACLRDEDEIARIAAWGEEARERYGITGTPNFVINGVVHKGAIPLSVVEQAVLEAGLADAEG